MKLYSIYDSTAEEFFAPFCAKNDDVAKRMITKSGAPYAGYRLFLVGKFSPETGIIEPVEPIFIFDVPVNKETPTNAV